MNNKQCSSRENSGELKESPNWTKQTNTGESK
jgi:hypothetical protein